MFGRPVGRSDKHGLVRDMLVVHLRPRSAEHDICPFFASDLGCVRRHVPIGGWMLCALEISVGDVDIGIYGIIGAASGTMLLVIFLVALIQGHHTKRRRRARKIPHKTLGLDEMKSPDRIKAAVTEARSTGVFQQQGPWRENPALVTARSKLAALPIQESANDRKGYYNSGDYLIYESIITLSLEECALLFPQFICFSEAGPCFQIDTAKWPSRTWLVNLHRIGEDQFEIYTMDEVSSD